MPFVVLYDANVLYPATLRDVLIRVATSGLAQAKWTDRILDEVFRNLGANRPDLKATLLARTRTLMSESIRDVSVSGYEGLIENLTLPDPDDRHVLAAAIKAKAQVIVTANLKDFPSEVLASWDIEARHPDDFLVDQFHLDALTLHRVVDDIAAAWRDKGASASDVLDSLERDAPRAAAILRR
ncbi:PIN domain-containing protein [Nocardioides terrisoli]|uniref:PIN domain-containing protein n=1 Tax=Nocardioides terrisoli TaxID=3388267 RepID=UPI00287B6C55|nr:PIN domain-containing protein [Nocardioides marmorisolisilvae]